MKLFLLLFLLTLFVLPPVRLNAAMSGGLYEIYADSLSITDEVSGTSSSFTLTDTSGEFFATSTAGGTITLNGGFQSQTKGLLSFSLSDASISLGTVSQTAVSSDSVTATVSTDNGNGYQLLVSEDGNLRSGSNDINDVGDGIVTAGSEEYGIRSSGTHGLLSNDTAISGSVAAASSYGTAESSQTTVTFRASAGSQTISGSYGQTVTFTVTVNP